MLPDLFILPTVTLKRKTTLTIGAGAFSVGCLVGGLWGASWWLMLAGLMVAAPCLAIRGARLVAFLAGGLFAIGALYAAAVPTNAPAGSVGEIAEHNDGARVQLRGRATVGMYDPRFENVVLTVWADELKLKDEENWRQTSGRLRLKIPHETPVPPGAPVDIAGTLHAPKNFETEDGGHFAYRDFLRARGVFATLDWAAIQVDTAEEEHFAAPFFWMRERFARALERALLPEASAFAKGILLGDRSGFPGSVEERFRQAGLAHIFALSGVNIAIVAVFLFGIFALFPPRIRVALTALGVLGFVLVVGFSGSVLRAAVMGLLGLFIYRSGAGSGPGLLLALACALLLATNPLLAAFDPSFQLSVAGVLGIVLFSPFLRRMFGSGIIAEVTAITLGAQLGVMPLIVMLFGEVSLIAPIMNLVVAPFVPLLMALGTLAALLSSFSVLLAAVAAVLTAMFTKVVYALVNLGASAPFASAAVPAEYAPVFSVCVAAAALALALISQKRYTPRRA